MKITYGQAINEALMDEMTNDSSVVFLGEDVKDNLYGYTNGLYEQFGDKRVINIPLSEASVVGMACGAAMCGLRMVVDLTLPNFLYIAMDQIANVIAKMCHTYNGKHKVPLTIFCSSMCGSGNAAQHSDRLHSLLMNVPGLKIICPASPQDMYSMLREAIRDENPVVCFADRSLFWVEEEITKIAVPMIGNANIISEGKDITIVTISSCLQMVKEIEPDLKEKGISADIIDVRSVVPLDYKTIEKSVRKTGRVIICDTANRSGSVANEIASLLVQHAFHDLKAPIRVVAGENVPVPFVKNLESAVIVSKEKIFTNIVSMFK